MPKTKNYPDISLLVTTYNWPQALELVLKSALCQTIPPDEIVVADDGSREETKTLIDSIRESTSIPIIHVWQEDKGFRAAKIRNKAIARCTKDYIVQIDGITFTMNHSAQRERLDINTKLLEEQMASTSYRADLGVDQYL